MHKLLFLTVVGFPKQITKDGLDVTFATNHFGPFLLTNLLLGEVPQFPINWVQWSIGSWAPSKDHCLCVFFSITDLLKRSAPARIVSVSSVNHKKGVVDFSHFHGENLKYGADQAYNHSKLHSLICTNELARRLKGTGGWPAPTRSDTPGSAALLNLFGFELTTFVLWVQVKIFLYFFSLCCLRICF